MNPPIFAFSSIKTQHKTVTYDKPNFKEEEIFLIKVMNLKLSYSEYLSDRKNSLE